MSSKTLKHKWKHCASGYIRGAGCERCEEIDIWKKLWSDALENMPWMFTRPERKVYNRDENGEKYIDKVTGEFSINFIWPPTHNGRFLALRMCLGYNCYTAKGKSHAWKSGPTAMHRGQKPRTAARQQLLKALAGPHGATVARVRLIQLGQAQRFHHWPNEVAK